MKAFSSMITNKNQQIKTWVDKGPNLLKRLKSFVLLRKNKFISTMSGTKAAFAELTMRSLKNILYRYMEE